TKPVYLGGLGFGMKWMMGWMHDTLEFFKKDPIYRRFHLNNLSFGLVYGFSENFMLPLSHDEVVYGKQSLLGRMPGDEWQRFANLRLLFGHMFTHPGTKLLFMGAEFGQSSEWNFQTSLDWHLLQFDYHKGVKTFISDLNNFYKSQPALYEKAFSTEGFEWIDYGDHQNSILTFIRKGHDTENDLIVVSNFTPNTFKEYQIGLPRKGKLKLLFNSDDVKYEGSGFVENGKLYPISKLKTELHGRSYAANIEVGPLSTLIYQIL
ncbi:MAG: 1,4-alpha-glucan branching enzyme, partial [Bacteroidetes bacterium HGW-Bacteroidetes-13]